MNETSTQRIRRSRREAEDQEVANETVRSAFVMSLTSQELVIKAQFASLIDMMQGWFSGVQGFDRANFSGDCMLVVTELAEAVEADRKDLMSDHIPDFHGRAEEVADAMIRLFHLAGKYNIDLPGAFVQKMHFNFNRPFKHGKGY